ncbi:MAG: hypothetical protein ACRYFR_11145 [Janthinobacterium lividum]
MHPFSPIIRPDITVSSAAGEEQLLVEVKSWTPTAAQALELRQQFDHFDCYFLLATPGLMLLWPPVLPGQPLPAAPYATEASPVLAGYLTLERHPLHHLSGQALSLVVSSWLGSVIFKPASALLEMPAQAWLVQSGLHERIYRGYIRRERHLGK